jgi:hypothetical protein
MFCSFKARDNEAGGTTEPYLQEVLPSPQALKISIKALKNVPGLQRNTIIVMHVRYSFLRKSA